MRVHLALTKQLINQSGKVGKELTVLTYISTVVLTQNLIVSFPFQRYRLALEMSPPAREGELLLNLGSVHHAMGEWDLAKAHYRQCLELEPNNQVVMKLLGSQLYELKNH